MKTTIVRTVFIAILVAVLFVGASFGSNTIPSSAPIAYAQDGGPCAEWAQDVFNGIVQDYLQLIEDDVELETVAAIQEMRREFEADDAPECAIDAVRLVVRMFDIRTDAMVAELLDEDDLSSDAEDADTAALESLAAMMTPGDTITGEIEKPEDGDEVAWQTLVKGTYSDDLDETQYDLWVVLLASNGRYYPQAISGCDETERASADLDEDDLEWQIFVYFGAEGDEFSGLPYQVILALATKEQSEEIWGLFDEWCSTNDYKGISDLDDYVEDELDSIDVERE